MAHSSGTSLLDSGIFGIRFDEELVIGIVGAAVGAVTLAALEPYYNKQAQHTSALSGLQWLDKLIEGHPDCMQTAFGVCLHIFMALLKTLHKMGYRGSKHVELCEQLMILLYTCITGSTLQHVREHFQCPIATVSKYIAFFRSCFSSVLQTTRCFHRMLIAFSSSPFYTKYVSQPKVTDICPPKISHNLRFYLYFANVLGTIDGTHITCTPSAAEQQTVPNYKGFLLQNCLQHGTLSDVVGALSYSQSLAHSHFSLSHHAVPQLALKLFMLAVCEWGICDFKMKASMTVQKTSTHLYTGSSPQASHGCHSLALVCSRGRHGKWCGQF
jgi:hypothetical protein